MARVKQAAPNVWMFAIAAALSGYLLGCTPVERKPAPQTPAEPEAAQE